MSRPPGCFCRDGSCVFCTLARGIQEQKRQLVLKSLTRAQAVDAKGSIAARIARRGIPLPCRGQAAAHYLGVRKFGHQ